MLVPFTPSVNATRAPNSDRSYHSPPQTHGVDLPGTLGNYLHLVWRKLQAGVSETLWLTTPSLPTHETVEGPNEACQNSGGISKPIKYVEITVTPKSFGSNRILGGLNSQQQINARKTHS